MDKLTGKYYKTQDRSSQWGQKTQNNSNNLVHWRELKNEQNKDILRMDLIWQEIIHGDELIYKFK